MDSDNLENIKEELSSIQHEILNLKNQEYSLNKKRLEILKEKCSENIGRCFKKMNKDKVLAYCKIISIDKSVFNIRGESFNEYQYPAIWFVYPYNNSPNPFYEDNLFSGAWGEGVVSCFNNVSYIEISKEEFLEKFKEVNNLWIEKNR